MQQFYPLGISTFYCFGVEVEEARKAILWTEQTREWQVFETYVALLVGWET